MHVGAYTVSFLGSVVLFCFSYVHKYLWRGEGTENRSPARVAMCVRPYFARTFSLAGCQHDKRVDFDSEYTVKCCFQLIHGPNLPFRAINVISMGANPKISTK